MKIHRKVVQVSGWGVLVAMLLAAAAGQQTTTVQLSGQVTDPSGAAVPGATVQAVQTQTGYVASARTGAQGLYQLPNLPIGPYRLTVHARGFKSYVQKGIVLTVGVNPSVMVKLQVGSAVQTVSVTANSANVETHNASVNQVIDRRRILALPLNGRNAASLVLLSGASTPQNGSGDINSSKNFNFESVTMSVAGSQGNETNFLLDGADNVDHFTNVNLPFPFPDAVQEFSVQTSDLSARYGVHPGGVVNVVTKSGTNKFHGDLFEFVRNYRFNAAQSIINYQGKPSAFVKGRDSLKRNQFGGTIGGPIIRNKLFFFGGFQGTTIRSNPPTKSTHVATQAVLNGDWSAMESPACNGGKAKSLKGFTNNTISPSSYNASALAILKNVPLSTDPCGLLYYGIPANSSEQQYIGRGDYTVSNRQSLYTHYFLDNYRLPPTYNGNLLTSTAYGQAIRSQSLVVGDNYSLTPNFINVLHLTGTRLRIDRGPASNLPNPTQFGVAIKSLVPNFIDFSISHYFSTGCGICSPGHFNTNTVQAADDVTWILGAHEIGFGGEYMHGQVNELSNFKSNGQFNFNGDSTSNALADFLLGDVNTFTQGQAEQENWRDNYFGIYLQDVWRATPRLTVNAGLRWDPYFPEVDKFHRGNHFDPNAFAAGKFSQVYSNAPAGLFFNGDPGTPAAYTSHHLLNLSPRLGLIWDPTGSGKTSIRAGYGIIYDYPEEFYFDRFADDAPWGSSINIDKPCQGFSNPYAACPNGWPGGDPFPLPFPPSKNSPFPPFGVYVNLPLHIRPTYEQQWNLSIQHELAANWLFEISYLGNKTTHLWLQRESNPAVAMTTAQCAAVGISSKSCLSTSSNNQRRLLYLENPAANFGGGYSSLAVGDDGGNANYNALLVSLNHRFSDSFTVLANYTYSRCFDYADFGGEISGEIYQNPFNRNADYGACGYDERHVFNSSFVAQTPLLGSAWERNLLGHWRVSGILTIHSGAPYSIFSGSDYALSGTGGQRPNLIFSPTVSNPSQYGWFDPAAFACVVPGKSQSSCGVASTPFDFGNAGRNFLYAPGAWNLDMGLSRYFPVFKEGQQIELRAEAFNLFNHANLGGPHNNMRDRLFGQITGGSGPRIMQFALKYIF